jgi:protocatechuate 3,4-dioxygenase beta subunit
MLKSPGTLPVTQEHLPMATHRIPHDEHKHTEIHDQGLQFDLQTLMNRRGALRLFGLGAAGATALVAIGCGDDDNSAPAPVTSTSVGGASSTTAAAASVLATATALVSPIPTGTTPASACVPEINQETAGPFPGDGSNGPNALAQSGIVRSDIRSSFGTSTKRAAGVPLMIELTIVDTAKNCAPMAGAAVYLWHCDRDGLYSMYSQGAQNENYCRGVQVADANGKVKFTTIFPAAYPGRWPHAHFEVYPGLAQATSSASKLITSQLALPDDVCKTVFATAGYEESLANHARTTLQNDGVFRDGVELQTPKVTGSVSAGYMATLTVGV